MTLKSIKHNPFKVVEMFEEEVAEYTGAPYAVAVDSCTNALFLSLFDWINVFRIFNYDKKKPTKLRIPRQTYVSVAQTIINLGLKIDLKDEDWSEKGYYYIEPTNVIDSAKNLTSDMYIPGTKMCLSFHIKKQLPIGKGGMILTDDLSFANWAKKARYEGRDAVNYHEDSIPYRGWNMYMTPEEAARGLTLMMNYPEYNKPQVEDPPYKDLDKFHKVKMSLA